jgi:hypothetical protein
MKNPNNYVSPNSPFYGEIDDNRDSSFTDYMRSLSQAREAWYICEAAADFPMEEDGACYAVDCEIMEAEEAAMRESPTSLIYPEWMDNITF